MGVYKNLRNWQRRKESNPCTLGFRVEYFSAQLFSVNKNESNDDLAQV